MSPRSLQRWSEQRRIGRRAWVRKYGVIYWGVSTAILFSILMVICGVRTGAMPVGMMVLLPFIAVPAFMAGGWLWGTGMWLTMEWFYARATAARHQPHDR